MYSQYQYISIISSERRVRLIVFPSLMCVHVHLFLHQLDVSHFITSCITPLLIVGDKRWKNIISFGLYTNLQTEKPTTYVKFNLNFDIINGNIFWYIIYEIIMIELFPVRIQLHRINNVPLGKVETGQDETENNTSYKAKWSQSLH